MAFSEGEKKILLELARKSIEKWVRERELLRIDANNIPGALREKRGVFVTIYKIRAGEKSLRGCIGFPHAVYPLFQGVILAAREACEDPRFPPLSESELGEIRIEVSVLSHPEKLEIKNREELPEKLEKNKGYIIKKGYRSALFLPQVWEELSDPEDFLAHLCFKAGLAPDCWLEPETEIYEFEAEIVEE